MFGWLRSVKEKSKEVVQLYKNEISNMVSQFDEDIKTLKTNINDTKKEEEKPKEGIELEDYNKKEAKEDENKVTTEETKLLQINKLLKLLSTFNLNLNEGDGESQDFLKEQIEFIEQNLGSYFNKDPETLVMISRDDFTNFHVFQENESAINQAKLMNNIGLIKGLPDNQTILNRVLYFLIYQFEEKKQEEISKQDSLLEQIDNAICDFNDQAHENLENGGDLFLKESHHEEKEMKRSEQQLKEGEEIDENWEIDEKYTVF